VVDAVGQTGRVDVGDEGAVERGREIGEGVGHVRTRVAVDGRLQDSAVDVDVNRGDAVGVERPSLHRERAGGVVGIGQIGRVDAAERRLVDRVVDVDGAAAQ